MKSVYIEGDRQTISVTYSFQERNFLLSLWKNPLSVSTTLSKKEARELAEALYEMAGDDEDDVFDPNQTSLEFAQEEIAA